MDERIGLSSATLNGKRLDRFHRLAQPPPGKTACEKVAGPLRQYTEYQNYGIRLPPKFHPPLHIQQRHP